MREIMFWKKLVWQIIYDYLICKGTLCDESCRLLFDGSGEWRHTFEWMCEQAGYEPSYVRRRVKRMEGVHIPANLRIYLGKNVMGEWGERGYNQTHWKKKKAVAVKRRK